MSEQVITPLAEVVAHDTAAAISELVGPLLSAADGDADVHLGLSLLGLSTEVLDALCGLGVDWHRVHVWQVEEPLEADPANAQLLLERLVRNGPLAESRLHRIDLAAGPAAAAAAHGTELGRHCGGRLDLVVLGLSPEGRTAGWGMADRSLAEVEDDVVVSVSPLGTTAVTLSPACLNRAGARLVVTEDVGREIAIDMLRAGSRRVPVGHLRRDETTLVITPRPAPPNVELDRIELDDDVDDGSRPHLGDDVVIDLRPFDATRVDAASGAASDTERADTDLAPQARTTTVGITARDLLIGDVPLALAPPVLGVADVAVSLRHGERVDEVLRGVSFHLERGESLAVMGASGSGKTTLLDVIAGLRRPDRGSVVVAGRSVGIGTPDEEAVARRRALGFVFQTFRLLDDLTAWENVVVPAMIDGRSPRRLKARALELLDQVGLADRADRRPGEMSGGERQRVAIARALITDPQLVLADEPTGNLDDATADVVLETLQTVTATGPALLLVTHDRSVAAMCHRTYDLVDGRLRRAQPAATWSPN